MTTNDLELSQWLTRAAQLHELISLSSRNGERRAAAELASEFHSLARSIDWRLHDIYEKGKP